jgi:hypothetical protein
VNEQVLAEIYANAIAQGVNPLMSSDNPFSDEWKRQVGYYGHNPIIDDRTPFATADYRPDFRFLDQWWRKYKPPVIEEEEELEEEKPVEKVLEEIISEGGGDRVASDGFTDMRDPAFMGRESYPGMKDGQWLGGNLGWKDAAQMLGTMKGGLGGLLSGMLNGSLSTYGSPSGKEAIGNIADALGVNKDTALAEIGRALGYSDPATAKRDTSILGQLFGGKPGTPNVKGMMAGTLAGYPNTWDNPTFSNIVNERDTIRGVLEALAMERAANPVTLGSWGKKTDGTWGAPDLIGGFTDWLGYDITSMTPMEAAIANYYGNSVLPGIQTGTLDQVKGYLKGLFDATKFAGTVNGTEIEKTGKPTNDFAGRLASDALGMLGKFDFSRAQEYLDKKAEFLEKEKDKSDSGNGGDGPTGGGGGYNETGNPDSGGHTEKGGASEGASREGR